MARRATLISQAREKQQNVLVLDAGNSLAYDQNPAKATLGQTSVEAMNSMRYDAAAVGAQDVALGPEVLRARAGEARFPLLSVNAYDRATNERVAQPFVATKVGGQTIYLLGVTQEASTDRIEVRDPVASVREVLTEIPASEAIVMLLSNAGAETDQQLAQQLPDVDVIVAGGGGMVRDLEVKQGSAPRLQADLASPGHAGRNVGLARLGFDPDGRLIDQSWERVRLGPEIAEDPATREWVQTVKSRE